MRHRLTWPRCAREWRAFPSNTGTRRSRSRSATYRGPSCRPPPRKAARRAVRRALPRGRRWAATPLSRWPSARRGPTCTTSPWAKSCPGGRAPATDRPTMQTEATDPQATAAKAQPATAKSTPRTPPERDRRAEAPARRTTTRPGRSATRPTASQTRQGGVQARPAIAATRLRTSKA